MTAISGTPSTLVVLVGFASYLGAFVLPREALPVLLLSLDAWNAAGAVEKRSQPVNDYARYISFGLALGALGDVCLDLGDDFFVPGLLAFLMGHGWFIFAFLQDGIVHSAAVGVSLLGVVLGLLAVLVPEVETPLIAPVIVYAATIGIMAYAAVTRKTRVTPSFMTAAAGSLLFVLSDSVLAVGKFKYHNTVRFTKLVVMLTYYAAQFLVCYSATALAARTLVDRDTAVVAGTVTAEAAVTADAAAPAAPASKSTRKRK